ncbi:Syntaxin-5 [Intoshia linei]|uniref:Syntaxin-5 n=1 Tax=Intoshia linei TaxID=1819745 RepID=A0A177B775_9BILA|nr:Syntaxin-5 [Intoshia linei]
MSNFTESNQSISSDVYSKNTQFSRHTKSNASLSISDQSNLFTYETQNRTKEFLQIVKNTKQTQTLNIKNTKPNNNNNIPFNIAARNITKMLCETMSKLQELTLLAKSKSIYDDHSDQIETFTYEIRKDIENMNQNISKLYNTKDISKKGSNFEKHSKTVVVGLQSKLANVSSDFKNVLQIRTENLKCNQLRRRQYGCEETYSSSIKGESILLRKNRPHRSNMANDLVIEMGNELDQQTLVKNSDSAYYESRNKDMQNIEETIVELGGIFTELCTLVKEQEEMVDRIDMQVEDTHTQIEAAYAELLKYFRTISANRWLMFKVFAILFLFVVIFLIFFL